jgi:N-acyl-D-amino-acid deacylase
MSQQHDLVIRNTSIVDGTGKAAFHGDVGIRGERIGSVGQIEGEGLREIDGAGLVTCPGFVDMHSHADLTILKYPLAQNLIMQGITTFVGGNCGLVPAPIGELLQTQFSQSLLRWWEIDRDTYGPPPFVRLDEYRERLEKELGFPIDWRTFGEFLSKVESTGISPNYVPLAGHNSIRLAVMGEDFKRTAKPDEVAEMAGHVERAMEDGAFGLSTGLDYVPGEYATTDEVLELLEVAQRHGGRYFTHHRQTNFVFPSTDPDVLPGLEIYHGPPEEMMVGRYRGLMEAIDLARKADIPLQVSHISNVFTLYEPHPPYLEEAGARATLEIIDKAREEGLEVTFDMFANSTGPFNAPNLIGIFHKWLILLGSKESLVEKLRIEEFRDELKEFINSGEFAFQMINPRVDPYWMEKLGILRSKNSQYEGKSIGEIAREKGTAPMDTILDVVMEDPDIKYRELRDERTTEAGIPVLLSHPCAMVGIDHEALDDRFSVDYPIPGYLLPHQNAYGMFPYYIATYVRETGLLTLEEAVRKTTHLPAQTLGMQDRGLIAPNAYADIVVLDFENVRMKGDFLNPWEPPDGIEYVLVNGEMVYENKTHTGVRSGKVLRRK